MNLPQEYYNLMEIKYREMLAEEKIIAESAKQRLLSINLIELKRAEVDTGFDHISEYVIAMEVQKYFNEAIYFQDDETLGKLKELKFKPHILRWFISLDELHKQYSLIQENHIKIDLLYAFNQIKSYLSMKFSNEILLQEVSTIRDGVVMTKLTNDLINLKGRRRYSGSDPKRYKDIYEILLNNQVKEFIKIPEEYGNQLDKIGIDTFIQCSKGKTERIYLSKMLENGFDYDTNVISKPKLLGFVYDLFRVILQDHNLIDAEGFEEERFRLSTYKNFYAYKAKTLRAIIGQKHRNG